MQVIPRRSTAKSDLSYKLWSVDLGWLPDTQIPTTVTSFPQQHGDKFRWKSSWIMLVCPGLQMKTCSTVWPSWAAG